MNIGPTRSYPFGQPLQENDGGALIGGVRIENQYIVFNFGTITNWICTTPEHAMHQSVVIGKLAMELSGGNLSMEKSGLGSFTNSEDGPDREAIKIFVNANGLIETRLKESVGAMAFDAQGAFNYAVKLAICVHSIRPDLTQHMFGHRAADA